VEDQARPRIAIKALDGVHLHQIVLARARADDLLAAAFTKALDNVVPEETSAAGDDHSLLRPVHDHASEQSDLGATEARRLPLFDRPQGGRRKRQWELAGDLLK
jgi:hypothetical protein